MKKKIILLVLALPVLLSGCMATSDTTENIAGKWYFAHIRKAQSLFGEMPPPPQFDEIDFLIPNTIKLKSSLQKWEFEGTYTLSGNNLSYSFHPANVKEPVKHDMECSLTDLGRTLILTYEQTEFVYYRPVQFYPNEIAGTWITEAKGKSEILRLGKEGSFFMEKSKIAGHYRLWQSRYGNAMTGIVFIPGHGGFLMIWNYEKENGNLKLTPMGWNGPEAGESIVWKQKVD